MTAAEKKVIFASSLGTVFEWYDFYLYGSLAAIIGAQFFSTYPPATRDIFALLAFAAGFLVRPFGAIVFGRVGDIVGRKYTFLVTILIMGLSTFIVGLLPGYATIGWAAPIILILLRMLQGFSVGGEFTGSITYATEAASRGHGGFLSSLATAGGLVGFSLGSFTAALIGWAVGQEAMAAWGWRLPFLLGALVAVLGLWMRRAMPEKLRMKRR